MYVHCIVLLFIRTYLLILNMNKEHSPQCDDAATQKRNAVQDTAYLETESRNDT